MYNKMKKVYEFQRDEYLNNIKSYSLEEIIEAEKYFKEFEELLYILRKRDVRTPKNKKL